MSRFFTIKIFVVFFIMFFSKVFAAATYQMSISNSTDYTILLSKGANDCIDSVKNFPESIRAHQTGNFSFTDSNNIKGCFKKKKYFTINGKISLGDQNQSINIIFTHDIENSTWQSTITGNSPGGALSLSNAMCNAQNCLNTSVAASGDFNISATIAASDLPMPMKVKSLQLGNVKVTNGFGRVIQPDSSGLINFVTNKNYIISFSKANAYCNVHQGMITCPSSIEFIHQGSDLLFVCSQQVNGAPACPWISIDKSIEYHMFNIYS